MLGKATAGASFHSQRIPTIVRDFSPAAKTHYAMLANNNMATFGTLHILRTSLQGDLTIISDLFKVTGPPRPLFVS